MRNFILASFCSAIVPPPPAKSSLDDSDTSLDQGHDRPDSYDHRLPPISDQDMDDFQPFHFKTSSKPSYLGSKMPGTRRHMKRLATDALIVVSQKGKPSLFITATTNSEWPEIQEKLLPGQTAYDRPDIVDMVFHQRLQALLQNCRSGVYFGSKRVTYEMYVIEYQHRGLPHAHIVVQSDGLKSLTREEEGEWIDTNISASMPERHEDPQLFELVKKFMVHKCSTDVNGCLDKDGHCTKHFDDTFPNEKTTFDSRGFPQYKRTD